jgi:hypothetical protein
MEGIVNRENIKKKKGKIVKNPNCRSCINTKANRKMSFDV